MEQDSQSLEQARFIRDYTEEEQFELASPSPAKTRGFGGLKPPQPNTRRRPRCPSCDDGLHRNWKQPNTRRRPRCPSCDDGIHYNGKQHNNMQDEPPEK